MSCSRFVRDGTMSSKVVVSCEDKMHALWGMCLFSQRRGLVLCRKIGMVRRCQCRNRKSTPIADIQSQGQAKGRLVLAPSPSTRVPLPSFAIIASPAPS